MKALARIFTPTGAMRAWATVTLLIIGFGLALGITIAYVAERSRDICGIVVLLDDRNQKLPPADKDTNDFRAELHHYRKKLGC